jgi:hypothetical protein
MHTRPFPKNQKHRWLLSSLLLSIPLMLAIYTVTAALFLVDSPCVDALLDIFCLGRRKIFYIFIFQEICSFTELTAIVYRSSIPGTKMDKSVIAVLHLRLFWLHIFQLKFKF